MQPSESRYGQVWTYNSAGVMTNEAFMLIAPRPSYNTMGVWIVIWLETGTVGEMSGIDIRPGYPLPAYTYVEG